MNSQDAHSRAELRALMRKQRAELPAAERRLAAERVMEQVVTWPEFQQSPTVAVYMAVGGELDPRPLAAAALDQGKEVYLPVLCADRKRRLLFRRWTLNTPMADNRLEIPEPVDDGTPARSPDVLGLVFVPLTAADPRGNRLGQGAGFYDRSFAFLTQSNNSKPRLAGLAYDFQIVERLAPEPWDVPLDFIVTPSGIISCG